MKKVFFIFVLVVACLSGGISFAGSNSDVAELVLKNVDRLPAYWPKGKHKNYSVFACSSRPERGTNPNDLRCTFLGMFAGGYSNYSSPRGILGDIINGVYRYRGPHAHGQYIVICRDQYLKHDGKIISVSKKKIYNRQTRTITFK